MSMTREKEILSSFTVVKGSWEAGLLTDISFQNITSLLWMNAGIREADKWSPLPTNLRIGRMSNYPKLVAKGPSSGRSSVISANP